MNVQLVRVGLLSVLHIPPPPSLAELPVNVQLVRVGLADGRCTFRRRRSRPSCS